MLTSNEVERSQLECEVRKLRKKLRQIQILECLDRTLTNEEQVKVSKKSELRKVLRSLLSSNADLLSSSLLVQHIPNISSSVEASVGQNTDSDQSQDPSFSRRTASVDSLSRLTQVDGCFAAPEKKANKTDSSDKKSCLPEKIPGEVIAKEIPRRTQAAKKEEMLKQTGTTVVQKQQLSDLDRWKLAQFVVKPLIGHDGIITDVAIRDNTLLLTGSQDTTVKLWDLATFEEIQSMCGHKDSVTAVAFLSSADSIRLAKGLDDYLPESGDVPVRSNVGGVPVSHVSGDLIGVSSSLDCCFKIWNLGNGCCLKSVYTFNPLTCLKIFTEQDQIFFICGTAGGKLEFWDALATTSVPVQSVLAFQDSITSLFVKGREIFATSADGNFQAYELSVDLLLHLKYDLEKDERPGNHGRPARTRGGICSVGISGETVYFGDDGPHVKAIDWKSGRTVRHLMNHTTEFGHTSCLLADVSGLLITSGYDLDNGLGYINIRLLPEENYACSLCDEETDAIFAMAASSVPSDPLVIATGGAQLKVWKRLISEESKRCQSMNGCKKVKVLFIPQFNRPVRALDEEQDSSDLEEESCDPPLPWQKDSGKENDLERGWLSWCNLL